MGAYPPDYAQLKLARLLDRKCASKRYTEKDIKVGDIVIFFNSVKENFKLDEDFTKIYIDNLEALGLLRYEEPEIEIDNGTSSADLNDDEEDKTQNIDLELDISANYNSSDDFHLTAFGNYFINQCKLKEE